MTEQKGKYRFRIPSKSRREIHNHCGRKFRRKDGWYWTDDKTLVDELRSVQLYPNSHDKTPLFEICTTEEAQRRHDAERLEADPAGTPASPRETPSRSRRSRRRRGEATPG